MSSSSSSTSISISIEAKADKATSLLLLLLLLLLAPASVTMRRFDLTPTATSCFCRRMRVSSFEIAALADDTRSFFCSSESCECRCCYWLLLPPLAAASAEAPCIDRCSTTVDG